MRKIIQIMPLKNGGMAALCDDGTVWYTDPDIMGWSKYTDMPQHNDEPWDYSDNPTAAGATEPRT